MSKVISIANQKGGVGKTTSCINIGSYLATKGFKVLLIDMDSQSSLTFATTNLVQIIENNTPTMNDVMLERYTIDDITIPLSEYSENLFLAPSTLELSDAELTIVNSTMRETILSRAIKKIKNKYDYIIIDCPPARGLLTINALSATDYLIIPLQADYLAYVGVTLLLNTVENVQEYINPNLKVLGYFFTMVEHTLHSKDVIGQAKEKFGTQYNSLGNIQRATAIKDASLSGMDIYNFDPKNKVSIQYIDLVENIVKEIEKDGY